jgi:hypothetical protein
MLPVRLRRRDGEPPIRMTLDGQKQRNALTGAEQAIRALAAGQPDRARKNAGKAADLDQLGLYAGFLDAIDAAARDVEASGAVSVAAWDGLADVVGPGPLRFLVEELRGS